MALLTISGCSVKIDDNDYHRVKDIKWRINSDGYVVWRGNKNFPNEIKLARFIMDLHDKKLQVDHANRDKLDNRRCNLRICTKTQNMRNRGVQKNNSSGYKGVYYNRAWGKWIAVIKFGGKIRFLGGFFDKDSAARKYNEVARKEFGDFAYINNVTCNESANG